MPGATLTTVDAISKEIYGPRIENQLQQEITAAKRMERSTKGVVTTVGGKYVDFPIKVRRNTGIGYRNEDEQLMAPGKQGYAEVHVGLKYGYGRVRCTGQVMELIESNAQAFADAMDEEMDGLKDDIAKDQARIWYGTGNGLITGISADGANTITVDNVQYLELDEAIDITVIADGTVLAANRTITAINETTKVVTYSGADATAVAGTHGVYRTGNWNREPQGFTSIVDNDSVLFGLDPALEPKWAALVNEGSGGANRALSEGLMIAAVGAMRRKGGKKPTVIFTSLGVQAAYFNLLTQQRRYTDTKSFEGGFVGLAFNYGTEIPVVEDLDAPPETMWLIHEPSFKIYRDKPWHWADKDGTVWKWVRDYDAWEALYRQYSEHGVVQRNAQGVIRDITEAAA